jgi:hypothetical protein
MKVLVDVAEEIINVCNELTHAKKLFDQLQADKLPSFLALFLLDYENLTQCFTVRRGPGKFPCSVLRGKKPSMS